MTLTLRETQLGAFAFPHRMISSLHRRAAVAARQSDSVRGVSSRPVSAGTLPLDVDTAGAKSRMLHQSKKLNPEASLGYLSRCSFV